MPFLNRSDGTLVRGENVMRRIMPFLMPRRSDSCVFIDLPVDVTNVLAYIERTNRDRPPEEHVAFFPIVLCALARTIALRPKMNRFVVGRRLYQRNQILFSLGVKKKLADKAVMTMAKVPFEPTDTIAAVHARMRDSLSRGRGDKATSSEKEMRLAAMLPRSILRFGMYLLRVADYFNLKPAAMIRSDELYATMVVANLGSVGIDAPYHHLYEWGTVSLFTAIGRIQKMPVVMEDGRIEARDVAPIKFTGDERIADGYYSARSLDLFRQIMQAPEQLERPPESLEEVEL